ncbi:MAG: hypothetical protein ABI536_02820 [Gallionella sp.]
MRTNHSISIVVAVALFGILIQYADAATNDKLDVNLSVIYVGTKSQKDSNALSEAIIQFPFPLTQSARNTGQGFFGGVTYFDTKSLVSDGTQLVSEMGLGRIYYSTSVPGDTPYTFVPFVTFYRGFSYAYKNAAGISAEIKGSSALLPGFMYAYRFNEKVAVHFDMEIYSYSERTNNRARVGFTYTPVWPWIISASHERFSWDIDSSNVFVDGYSRENSLKVIFRDPPQGNFALTIGYGNEVRNAAGSGLLFPSSTHSKGTYFGVEASGGVLAW